MLSRRLDCLSKCMLNISSSPATSTCMQGGLTLCIDVVASGIREQGTVRQVARPARCRKIIIISTLRLDNLLTLSTRLSSGSDCDLMPSKWARCLVGWRRHDLALAFGRIVDAPGEDFVRVFKLGSRLGRLATGSIADPLQENQYCDRYRVA
jgi:hypothetical protein